MSVGTWLAMEDLDRLVFAGMTALAFLDNLSPGCDAFVGDPEQGGLNVNGLLRASLRPYMPESVFKGETNECKKTKDTTAER